MFCGHLAQLGEHFLDVEGVRGSSPLVPILFYKWESLRSDGSEVFFYIKKHFGI